ncbi:MAG: hypothetical protein LUQ24_09045 [Methanobacterium sp.]|nr:hypothetical protein [Methanobacterium sp.]
MRKLATLSLLLLSFSLVFIGAVAAAPEVDVEVDDENGDPVTVTSPGDEVNVTANATTDEYLEDPAVLISVDPDTGLTFDADKAVMNFDGDIYQNDPEDPFFFWSDDFQGWIWWIGWVYGDQLAGEVVQLSVPAIVSDVGDITVDADYMEWPEQSEFPIFLDSDSFTFLSVGTDPVSVSGETVPMQDTGVPFAAAALGLLSIIGGTLYGKFR